MPIIHWAGTGLSAVPGLKRLIKNGHQLRVYNRSVSKAKLALEGIEGDFEVVAFELDELRHSVKPGDVVVSMLPADFHLPLAEISLAQKAHFVSSSYISEPMQQLNDQALEKGLCLVNEVGLDPGIDHSLAHSLLNEYTQSDQFAKQNAHSFLSYCGGLSKEQNDFCYRFSWSPLGVLKALKSASVSIRDGAEYHATKPWESVQKYTLDMPWGAEQFEVYPNRDSRPFIDQYHLGEDWNIQQFVRGTLRYNGWTEAWADIFAEIDQLSVADDGERLKQISDDLWQQYALKYGEYDRVVLSVELKVERDDKVVWHKSYMLDAFGNEASSAMARLVSTPVSMAVEAILQGEIPAGVSAAPDQADLVERWISMADDISDHFSLINHLEK